VFPSGYQAAVTLLATLCALDETPPRVLLDKLCHASLIDGATLARAKYQRFKHNSAADLEKYLARHAPGECLVVVESIYSMDGDAAPLAEVHAVCHRFQALLVIDDAHATGVLGPSGSGLTQAFAADENVIVLGTLSKALGAQGGFVAAHEWAVDLLIQMGRGFLFTTGLAPAAAGAALAAVERLPALDAARKHLARLRAKLVAAFESRMPANCHPVAAIVPVVIGPDDQAVAVAEKLLADGFYVPAVRPPTVPPGTARLRISLSAAQAEADVDSLIAALHRRLA
jgi:7-keto-8-aminopelargonate synthetase-like enzyme